MKANLFVAALLGVALLGASARADEAGELEGRALFTAGNQHLADGDYVGALDLFRAAHKRFPSVKILLNIGTTLRALGRYAEAADAYEAYLRDPAADPAKKGEIQKLLAELDAKVGKLNVTVEGGAAMVRVDGRVVGKPGEPVTLRVDPGPHVISADREGTPPVSQNVTSAAGKLSSITLRFPPPSAAPPPPPKQPPVGPAEPPAGPKDTAQPAPENRSHRNQLGLIARADIDGQRAGVVPAFGLSFGIGDHFEINTVGLVGKSKGVEPGATAYILKGAWKPRVSLGVPIFVNDGVRPGVHASVGMQWDPIRHLGVFVDAGITAFPTAATGMDKVVFVPSVGLQPRL